MDEKLLTYADKYPLSIVDCIKAQMAIPGLVKSIEEESLKQFLQQEEKADA